MSAFWPGVLSRLLSGEALDRETASEAMRSIMGGDATPAQVAGFVVALRAKGETAEEIEGLAAAMLEFAKRVEVPGPVIDTCGTGGDRAGTINVSTAAAIVAAGAGAVVAKHGNRAASSRCGSADVLEGLGVKIDLSPDGVARCLDKAGIGFMFAPIFHPAMAHAGGPRRELGIPTVFNFLGPLTNPAGAKAQVVGVSDALMLPKLAEVLARRGETAMVFRGDDGLDELTTTGPSAVHEVANGSVSPSSFDPADLDIPRASAADLVGGDVATNVAVLRGVLAGDQGPPRDIVALNAAAALKVAGLAPTLADGLTVARESIDSGAAGRALARWVEVSNA